MTPRSASLRGQLLWWLLLPLSLLLSLAGFLVYSETTKLTTLAYDRSLFDSTQALASQVQFQENQVRVDLPPEARAILRYDEHDKIYFQVKDAQGQILAGDRVIPFPPPNLQNRDKPIFYDGTIAGRQVRIAALFLTAPISTSSGVVLIQVAETMVKRDVITREALLGIIVTQLIILAFAALLVWLGVRRGLAPLNVLREEIASRSHVDLGPVPERDAPIEVRPLLHSINDLLTRLKANIDAQHRFIADAAHQLRTPLAGIQMQAEFALRQSEPEHIHHALQQLSLSAERASRLANQLLTLARAEPGALAKEHFQPVDLSQLIKQATVDWVPAALKKQIDLGYEGGESAIMIHGDQLLLQEMINNLLDNAIRYCPEGARVTTRVSRGERSTLVVEDNGPGIPAEERDHVFQRFYRAGASDVIGSGLGLAIVGETAKVHDAEVRLESLVGERGTRISILFQDI